MVFFSKKVDLSQFTPLMMNERFADFLVSRITKRDLNADAQKKIRFCSVTNLMYGSEQLLGVFF
jgi:hypothetical protein